MQKVKKIINPFVLFTLLLVLAFNAVAIRFVFGSNVSSDSTELAAQTELAETTFKVKNYDESIKKEYDKNKEIKQDVEEKTALYINNSISSSENVNKNEIASEDVNQIDEQSDLTEEDIMDFAILQMIYEEIAYSISDQGFQIFESTALDLENNVQYFGLTYTENVVVQDNYIMAGFVRIVSDDSVLDTNINLLSLNNGEDDGYRYIITNYDIDKSSNHFIYCDKYIKYEFVNDRTIKYTILDNNQDNYDLNLGQLFSYDNFEYVYENDFTYTSQQVIAMFNNIDFDKLQATIDKINEEQKANGYYVQEVTITYIDLDLINEWERCQDKTTFFGYDLEQLNETFGADSTLQFDSDGGVKKGELIKTTNWLKAGLMFLGGCAAMLIGAALAPLTGGCSFGASLLCIMKMTAVAVVTDLLTKTLISTITGVISGKSFFDSLSGAIKTTFTVENIAQTFMVSAIMSAVMVGSGLVKACFTSGTPVLTENGYKSIEEINVGDKVLSYSELSNMIVAKEVTDVLRNKSDDICNIALSSGDTITSTSLHPWYVQGKGWVPAYALSSTDNLLTNSGESVKILGVQRQKLDEPIDVYNITVGEDDTDEFHNYFVGGDEILVHNACKTETKKTNTNNNNKQLTDNQVKYQRRKAVNKAWEKEQNAFLNGESKYPWKGIRPDGTIEKGSEAWQLINKGKVSGYDGCHLIDVQKCKELGRFNLIGDPDNIVFLKRFGENSHFYIHGNNWKNLTDLNKVKNIFSWVIERLDKLF